MSRDILFKEDTFVFSSRVSGVMVHDGRVLVQCPPGTTEHAFIGGHVMVGETQAEALVREFMEELHAPVTPVKLLAVGEVFIPWGKRPAHQIGLYYKVQLDDPAAIPLTGSFRGYDELGGERIDLEFKWIPLEELPGLEIYPPDVVPFILQEPEGAAHFVYREIGRDAFKEA